MGADRAGQERTCGLGVGSPPQVLACDGLWDVYTNEKVLPPHVRAPLCCRA